MRQGMARRLLPWLTPVAVLGALLALLNLLSAYFEEPARHFQLGDTGSLQFVLNTNAAALTSAMSVLIALVLLTVQLTAQRYSFNVIDIFIHNRVNAALIGYFILTITFNLWLALVLKDKYTPTAGTILAMLMMTVGFALLPPYIIYLFDVLRPDHILNHLQSDFLRAIDFTERTANLPRQRTAAAARVNQIGDIARTAVNLSDSAVARHSVWVLYWSISRYVERKAKLPSEWFAVEEHHFRGRHELIMREIEETMTWLERRMLEALYEVFYATLNKMHDVNNTVALVARLLGEKAVDQNDMGLLQTVIKFFNTYLRAAINLADQRAGYHVLYQYRLLADTAMEPYPEIGLQVADRLSYYGDAAAGGPLLWMSLAAAYDLRILAENCVNRRADRAITTAIVHDLVETLQRAEAKRSPALSQLYKPIAALGSFFMVHGEADFAHQLRARLNDVPEATLEQISRELGAVEDPIFWEFTDRVVNFDYIEEDVRAALPAFLKPVERWPDPEAAARSVAPEAR